MAGDPGHRNAGWRNAILGCQLIEDIIEFREVFTVPNEPPNAFA
jgi:hypothetical protein